MRRALVVLLLPLTGCATLLGLDDAIVDDADARTDVGVDTAADTRPDTASVDTASVDTASVDTGMPADSGADTPEVRDDGLPDSGTVDVGRDGKGD